MNWSEDEWRAELLLVPLEVVIAVHGVRGGKPKQRDRPVHGSLSRHAERPEISEPEKGDNHGYQHAEQSAHATSTDRICDCDEAVCCWGRRGLIAAQ